VEELDMTKDRDFKSLVRERMTETGESYATARANLRGGPTSGNREPRRFRIPDWPMTGRIAALRDAFGPTRDDLYVEVDDDGIDVHNGAGTEFRLPREAVVEARRCDGLSALSGVGRGNHIKLLYGAGGTVVAIKLDREVIVQIAGQPELCRELRVGVDDADGLVALLR
jgi:hypothetical protein